MDAQVVGHALTKCRSSVGGLRPAISIVAVLKLSLSYLPSESNAADWPSRGNVRKRVLKRPKPAPRGRLDLMERACCSALRHVRACSRFGRVSREQEAAYLLEACSLM